VIPSSAVLVKLVSRKDGTSFTTPSVPGDELYTAVVRIGSQEIDFGPYRVPAGGSLRLKCNTLTAECDED
jgi:hypothetical protein